MAKYMLKRIFAGIVTIWVVITITFLLMHSIPGGPFDKEKQVNPEVKKQMEARYNLDKPLWWQYGNYMKNLVKFDFGPSFKYKGKTVNDLIKNGFPISAQLGVVSTFLALLIGIPFGIIAALKQGRWQDNLIMFLATLGITIPMFVIAAMSLYIFALKIGLFPTMSWGTPAHFVLPSIALAAGPTAVISRLTRSSLLDVIRQDYIRTAKAKGIPDKIVVYKHALKNALIPVVTYIGPLLSGILTGSFVIERIFTIPGLGRQFVDSITNRDYTAILGLTIFDCTLLVVINILVDMVYTFIDPRIKLDN
jgi:oligopeptide transport system permease protein